MKKIMILGAGIYQVPIIKRAKELGLHTVVISPEGDYPGFEIADSYHYIDVKDVEVVLSVAEKEGINGITTDQTDIAVRTEAYVSEQMGLPGISYECARIFTDKSLMRDKCEELGIPSLKYKSSSNIKEVKDFFDGIGGSAIMKPVDNQGSRGVYKINKSTDIDSLFDSAASYSRTGQVIIEEYIDGKEYELDSIVFDYEEQNLLYGDVIPFDIPNIFASRIRMFPSQAESELVDRLIKYNSEVIRGFGLKQGLTHGEYIVDDSGQPYLLEIAARGGGCYISSHIVKLKTGIDTAEYLIKLALNEIDRQPVIENMNNACCCVSFFLPKGTVVSVDGISEAKKLSYVHAHDLDKIAIGKKIGAFSDKTDRYVSVLSADTKDELYRRIDDYRKTIRVVVDTNHGFRGPIWG